jgi:hypothetical protein
VGSIAGCAIDGTGAKLPTADAIINDDNGPMNFIAFPLVDIFQRRMTDEPELAANARVTLVYARQNISVKKC